MARWEDLLSFEEVQTALSLTPEEVEDLMSSGSLPTIQPPRSGTNFDVYSDHWFDPTDVFKAAGVLFQDDFSRVASNGWGGRWGDYIAPASELSVDGTHGIWTPPSTPDSSGIVLVNDPLGIHGKVDILTNWLVPDHANLTGGYGVWAIWVGPNNDFANSLRIDTRPTNGSQANIISTATQQVANVSQPIYANQTIKTIATPTTPEWDIWARFILDFAGGTFSLKVWGKDEVEPAAFQVDEQAVPDVPTMQLPNQLLRLRPSNVTGTAPPAPCKVKSITIKKAA